MKKILTIALFTLTVLAYISQMFFFILGLPLAMIFFSLGLLALSTGKFSDKPVLKITAIALLVFGVYSFVMRYPEFSSQRSRSYENLNQAPAQR